MKKIILYFIISMTCNLGIALGQDYTPNDCIKPCDGWEIMEGDIFGQQCSFVANLFPDDNSNHSCLSECPTEEVNKLQSFNNACNSF